jgi:hypothetical protein
MTLGILWQTHRVPVWSDPGGPTTLVLSTVDEGAAPA